MGSLDFTDRSRRLLVTLVREYIATGEPVPSQMLARASGLGVSSATIRNVLAQLEEAGYVHQPHTSAGRVPTDRGYRVFVDMLLEARKPGRRVRANSTFPHPCSATSTPPRAPAIRRSSSPATRWTRKR